MDDSAKHYLELEFLNKLRDDPRIFEFLDAGALDGVWYWDIENPEEEWYSHHFKAFLGFEDNEVPNKSSWWQSRIHPDDLRTAIRNFEQHCQDESHPYDQNVRYSRKDGEEVWIRCRGLLIRNENGEPIRLLGAHSDITALKRTELELRRREEELIRLTEELKESNQALLRANSMLEQFASVASHDLRAPVRQLTSFLSLLGDRIGPNLDEEESRWFGFAETATSRMQTLLDDILELTQLKSESESFQPTSLKDCFQVALDSLQQEIEEAQAQVEIVGNLPTFSIHKEQISRLFQNLIQNAIKYRSDAAPLIKVSAEEFGEHWTISVRDNGIGIDPEYGEEIFQLFRRLHSIKKYPGTGIGLSLCAQIVQNHQGRIWVVSAKGQGSTFKFSLKKNLNHT